MLKKLNHIRRYRQIINVFARYGFREIIRQIRGKSPSFAADAEKNHDNISTVKGSARLRMALEELGPAFIKIGQLLSTRADLLPEDYITELTKLQDSVSPISAADIIRIIESELRIKIDEVFAYFTEEPMAVASIGQVHHARLATGEELAIKIKKPNIEPQIIQDLDIIENIAVFLEKRTAWGKAQNIGELATEIKNNILEELDYKNEGRNAERFANNFKESSDVLIPAVYWEYTTRNVLSLEFKKGRQLNTILENKEGNSLDRSRLANALVDAYFKQIFEHGFFHGDPHPGNILIYPPDKVMFVDFGAAGFISEGMRHKFQYILRAIINEETGEVAEGIIELGFAPENVDRQELVSDLGRIQDKYYHTPLDNIELSDILKEYVNVSYKHNIRLPREFLLLVKTLGTLEGIVSRLDPDYKLIDSLNNFKDTANIDFIDVKQLRDLFFIYEKALTRIPSNLNKITEHAAKGELKVKIEMVNTEKSLKSIGRMANRLSFSLVLAALIIGLSIFMDKLNFNIWPGFSVIKTALVTVVALGFLWLLMIIRAEK